MRTLRRFAAENLRGLVFVAGAAWGYHGVAAVSAAAANMLAGVVLMAIGAYPYVQRTRKH